MFSYLYNKIMYADGGQIYLCCINVRKPYLHLNLNEHNTWKIC